MRPAAPNQDLFLNQLLDHFELHFQRFAAELGRASVGSRAQPDSEPVAADQVRRVLRSLRSAACNYGGEELTRERALALVDAPDLNSAERQVLLSWVERFMETLSSPAAAVPTGQDPDDPGHLASGTTRRRLGRLNLEPLADAAALRALEAVGADLVVLIVLAPEGGMTVAGQATPRDRDPEPVPEGTSWADLEQRLAPGEAFVDQVSASCLPAALVARWQWVGVAPLQLTGPPPEVVGALVAFSGHVPTREQPLERLANVAHGSALALGAAEISLAALEGAVAEERANLARELHDGLANDLAAIVSHIKLQQATGEEHQGLDRARALSEAALQQARDILQALRRRRRDDQWASVNVRREIEQASTELGISLDYQLVGSEERLRPVEVEAVLQVIREALANARRHASVSSVTVSGDLTVRPFWVEIIDHGRGFDVDATLKVALAGGRFGITGMEERTARVGGTLEVRSVNGQGTTIRITGPSEMRRGET